MINELTRKNAHTELDHIFKTILPAHGMTERPEQIRLSHTMLKTGTPYNEECFEQRRLRCERKRANRLVNELQKLGYVVVAPD